jgi:hypothetical protein
MVLACLYNFGCILVVHSCTTFLLVGAGDSRKRHVTDVPIFLNCTNKFLPTTFLFVGTDLSVPLSIANETMNELKCVIYSRVRCVCCISASDCLLISNLKMYGLMPSSVHIMLVRGTGATTGRVQTPIPQVFVVIPILISNGRGFTCTSQ